MKLNKTVQFNKKYFFSLVKPHWPSNAFNTMIIKGGFNLAAKGEKRKVYIDSAVLSITQQCLYKCKHCYEQYNLKDNDSVSGEYWKKVIRELQDIGTGIIIFSGGEPMMQYDKLKKLVKYTDNNISDIHLYTSGFVVTRGKAKELKQLGLNAVGIGLDDGNLERYDTLRGYRGAYKEAINAIECFYNEDIFPYLNVCLTKELVRSKGLWELLALAKARNVGFIRLLDPKPCGGYLFYNREELFTSDDKREAEEYFLQSNTLKQYRNHPLVTYIDYLEAPERLGCMMGGLSHLHIDSKGNVTPCVFLQISFGNIKNRSFKEIYEEMRSAVPFPVHKKCPSFYFSDFIRDYKKKGNELPVPYSVVKERWRKMLIP